MKVKVFWLLIACNIAMIPATTYPQVQAKGSISGLVRDSLGAGIAGVQVTVQRSDGAQIERGVSGNAGDFQIAVDAGTWSLKFLAPNFKTAVVQNIVVDAEHQSQIDVTLIVGSESELVTTQWTPASAGANPEAADSQTTPSVKSLPLSSRNYTQAAGLASGVSSQVSNATAIGMNSQGVQVGSGSTSNYMMDGVTIATTTNDPNSPGATNPDAIDSNSVQSWSYSAGPERYSGANISVVTKSGSDAFHGTLFEFVRNDIFNANDFFVKMQGHPEPVLKQNQFGLTLGGPLLRERSYFFLAYQGTRQSNGFSGGGLSPAVTLPSLPSSRTAATLGPAFCPTNHIGDSRYSTLFGGVQVACDGSNINPVAVNLLNLKLSNGNYVIPSSNNGTFQTIPYSIPATFREDQVLLNTDYKYSGKERLTEKFFASNDPQLSNFTGSPNELPGFPTTATSVEYNGVVRLTSTLSDRLLNEFRLSGRHNLVKHTPDIPFTNEDQGIASIVSGIKQLDSISVAGLFALGGADIWDYTSINQYALGDQASWDHGKQSMRFGVDVDRRQWNASAPAYARGSLAINSLADFLLGLPGCPPGNSACFSNPVVNGQQTNGTSYSNIYGSIGPANSAYVTASSGVQHAFRYSETSAYFQDNIKLLPRLTLNTGLRWDYFGLPADTTGNNTNFWPSLAGAWSAPRAAGSYLGYVVPSNFNGPLASGVTRSSGLAPLRSGALRTNFAPRVGFSLQPLAKSSLTVRGGYGLFYDRPDEWIEVLQSMAAVPYAVPVGGTGQPNYAASWALPFVDGALGWGAARSVDMSSGTSSNLILNSLDENLSVPLTQKWNIEIQQQFPKGITAVIGYAGAHSVRLQDASHEINVPRLASPGSPVNGITTNTVENAPLRVPFLALPPTGSMQKKRKAAPNSTTYRPLSANMRRMVCMFRLYTLSARR